jgi:hypothetical protein
VTPSKLNSINFFFFYHFTVFIIQSFFSLGMDSLGSVDSLEDIGDQNENVQAVDGEVTERPARGQNLIDRGAFVHRVSVKLPPFWAERPGLWFSQAESQFAISGITSEDAKFHYIVAQLDTRYAAEVEDVITSPPVVGKYQTLKAKLIQRLSISEEQRVRKLISDEDLGDRKPSQFLRHLRTLAGSSPLQEKLLRQLWVRRLPQQVQVILTTQLDLPLDKLADLADRILEVQPSASPAVSAVSTAACPEPEPGNALLEAIQSLSRQVSELSANYRRGNQSNSRPRSRSMSRSNRGLNTESNTESTDSKSKSHVCWYHRKFGNNAYKCILPCGFSGNAGSSQ